MSKGGPGIGSLLRRTLQTVLRGAPVAIAEPPPVTPGELTMEELRALLGKNDPVILEIGCNDGMHTQKFLDTFAGARVYGFEPDERARRRFQAAVHDPRAQLFATAVGAIDGVTTFYPSTGAPDAEWAAKLPEGWDISGSIRVPKEHREVHPWCHFGPGMDVAVTRLDTWAKTHAQEHIDFIWADVQGAEGDLIAGGRKTLAKTRYFYTEYSNRELYEGQLNLAAILRLLPDFEVIRRYKGDVLLRNKRLTAA
jgi:FkbM family methyltransferase